MTLATDKQIAEISKEVKRKIALETLTKTKGVQAEYHSECLDDRYSVHHVMNPDPDECFRQSFDKYHHAPCSMELSSDVSRKEFEKTYHSAPSMEQSLLDSSLTSESFDVYSLKTMSSDEESLEHMNATDSKSVCEVLFNDNIPTLLEQRIISFLAISSDSGTLSSTLFDPFPFANRIADMIDPQLSFVSDSSNSTSSSEDSLDVRPIVDKYEIDEQLKRNDDTHYGWLCGSEHSRSSSFDHDIREAMSLKDNIKNVIAFVKFLFNDSEGACFTSAGTESGLNLNDKNSIDIVEVEDGPEKNWFLVPLQYEECTYESDQVNSLVSKLAAVEHSPQNAGGITVESSFEFLGGSLSTYPSEDKYLEVKDCGFFRNGEEIEPNDTDWDYSFSLVQGVEQVKVASSFDLADDRDDSHTFSRASNQVDTILISNPSQKQPNEGAMLLHSSDDWDDTYSFDRQAIVNTVRSCSCSKQQHSIGQQKHDKVIEDITGGNFLSFERQNHAENRKRSVENVVDENSSEDTYTYFIAQRVYWRPMVNYGPTLLSLSYYVPKNEIITEENGAARSAPHGQKNKFTKESEVQRIKDGNKMTCQGNTVLEEDIIDVSGRVYWEPTTEFGTSPFFLSYYELKYDPLTEANEISRLDSVHETNQCVEESKDEGENNGNERGLKLIDATLNDTLSDDRGIHYIPATNLNGSPAFCQSFCAANIQEQSNTEVQADKKRHEESVHSVDFPERQVGGTKRIYWGGLLNELTPEVFFQQFFPSNIKRPESQKAELELETSLDGIYVLNSLDDTRDAETIKFLYRRPKDGSERKKSIDRCTGIRTSDEEYNNILLAVPQDEVKSFLDSYPLVLETVRSKAPIYIYRW